MVCKYHVGKNNIIMYPQNHLALSNQLDKLFADIVYSDFHVHTSKLLKKIVNSETLDKTLDLKGVLSSRFLIWDSNNKEKKYKKIFFGMVYQKLNPQHSQMSNLQILIHG